MARLSLAGVVVGFLIPGAAVIIAKSVLHLVLAPATQVPFIPARQTIRSVWIAPASPAGSIIWPLDRMSLAAAILIASSGIFIRSAPVQRAPVTWFTLAHVPIHIM